MQKNCMKCGAELIEGAQFCIKCGESFTNQKQMVENQNSEPSQTIEQPATMQYTEPLGIQLVTYCHPDWDEDQIKENIKIFCPSYDVYLNLTEIQPNVFEAVRDFKSGAKQAMAGEYRATIMIGTDPEKGKYVLVDYVKGSWRTKAYVKIFWSNLFEGLKNLFSMSYADIQAQSMQK